MKFREYDVDDIIVIEPCEGKKFVKKLKELHEKYDVIDLQYSTLIAGHSALALVRNKK